MFWYYSNLKGETGLHRRGSTHSSTLWDDKRQTASEHPGISHQRDFYFHLTSEMSAKQKSFLASRWHWQGRLTRLHWASQVSDRGWPIKSWRSISNLFYKEAFFVSTLTFELFQWREDKFTIWDDSFENELHNESGTAQVATLRNHICQLHYKYSVVSRFISSSFRIFWA